MLHFFKNLKIFAKILSLSTLLLLFVIIVAAYSLNQTVLLSDKLKSLSKEEIAFLGVANEVSTLQLEKNIYIERALRLILKRKFNESASFFDGSEPVVNKHNLQLIKKTTEGVQVGLAEIDKLVVNLLSKQWSAKIEKNIVNIREDFNKLKGEIVEFDAKVQAFFAASNISSELIEGEILQLERQQDTIDEHIISLMAGVERLTLDIIQESEQLESSAVKRTVIFTLVSVLVGTCLAFMIAKNIRVNLNKGISVAQQLSSGNLAVSFVANQQQDEVGQLLRELELMSQHFRKVLSKVTESSMHISQLASTLSNNTSDTAKDTEAQQSGIEQIASSITEMVSSIQEVSKNAHVAAESTQHADQQATEGHDIVSGVTESISTLVTSVENTSEVIKQLAKETANVESILDVIGSIAEQTNLLALNAAIEAARAGEQGKGFAVVADEVRSLALRTHESTQQIQTLIRNLQQQASNSVTKMDEGCTYAAETVQRATKAEASLKNIASAVNTINSMNMQIASAAEEQSSVAELINQSVEDISHKTQLNAERTHQISKESHDLSSLAETLQSAVKQFKTN
ncbi:methyl-accepting chemotaxis protein [Zooshikella marina]|uniref:Methyl-accepting chemotaxis protein n=1 Tax=Zooshikella ganghwensis TaxID=202772 RepID=A0A4P9VN04_9GAMM|nr:methyl-accepting chemotaxis protein [Zooshikella ganghwensis]MBU2708334.1 methyl-accepting chemotaxis protein [Zooshikella ganghwensis]RDH44019.1 methyl-accepting chemotaxis protein [Zooshikella ganghwensis]